MYTHIYIYMHNICIYIYTLNAKTTRVGVKVLNDDYQTSGYQFKAPCRLRAGLNFAAGVRSNPKRSMYLYSRQIHIYERYL